MSLEKRRALRTRPTQPTGIWIRAYFDGKTSEMAAKVIDTSQTGLSIRIPVELPAEATIEIAPGGGCAAGSARVAWCRQDAIGVYRAGLQRLSAYSTPDAIPTQEDGGPAPLTNVHTERMKRREVLQLLYANRASRPRQPNVTIKEMESQLECPREQLEFPVWYLKEQGYVSQANDGACSITVKGVDYLESLPDAV